MSDLTKALQILRKYGDPKHEAIHDELAITGVDPLNVLMGDLNELFELGFAARGGATATNSSDRYFVSYDDVERGSQ